MSQELSYLILQCRCLNHSKPDDGQFNLNFTDYYNALAKEFLPYLAVLTKSHRDPLIHKDIFQQLMFYHYTSIKDERETTYIHLQERSPLMACSMDNVFLTNRIKTWGGNIQTWADKAKNFCACEWPDGNPPECEVKAYAINQELMPLREEADEVIRQQGGKVGINQNTLPSDENDEQIENWEIADSLEKGAATSADLSVQMYAVLNLASKVRIPMKPLLYWKARKLILDCWRNKGDLPLARSISLNGNEPKNDAMPNEEECENLDELDAMGIVDITDSDAVKERNLRKVEALLYAPVKAAKTVLKSVRTNWERERAQKRLDNEEAKFLRRREVFYWLMLGHGETEIVDLMQITRDKVRTDIENVHNLLHNGFKTEFGDFRREQRLEKLLPALKAISTHYEASPASEQPDSEMPNGLIAEFDRLLKAPVKRAESELRKAEAEKRQAEDDWLTCCFAPQRNRLLAPEEERILRQDSLQWIGAEDLTDREIALRLNIRPEEVAKHRQKLQKTKQVIQSKEHELTRTLADHEQESPKILAVLRVLVSNRPPEAIAQTLGLAIAEIQPCWESIQTLLSA